jgi:hypothetical protein
MERVMHRPVPVCLLKSLILALLLLCATAEVKDACCSLRPKGIPETLRWKNEGPTRRLTVPPNGTIASPLTRKGKGDDLSLPEAQETVGRIFSEPLPDAPVTGDAAGGERLASLRDRRCEHPGVLPVIMKTTFHHVLPAAAGSNAFAEEDGIR